MSSVLSESSLGAYAAQIVAAALRRGHWRGRARLGMELGRRCPPAACQTFDIPMARGHRMVVPASSVQSWRAAFSGQYDDEIVQWLSAYVHPGTFVLDIGASLGFYAIPLGRVALALNAAVVAIEPGKENCDILTRNVGINRLGGVVQIMCTALGAAESSAWLHLEGAGAGNGSIADGVDPDDFRRHENIGNMHRRQRVLVKTLDSLASSLPPTRCSLIKLDVEGFEYFILQGAEKFVNEHRPLIFGEFSEGWQQSRGISRADIFTWARTHCYSVEAVTTARIGRMTDTRRVLREQVTVDDLELSSGSIDGLLLAPCPGGHGACP